MPRSRVFILYSHGLFARGVQSLLSQEGGIEVIGMERDDRQAIDRIRALRPDVILVDSSDTPEDHCLTISGIFQEMPEARVINLSLQENGIDVYDKQRITAAGPEDLLRILRRGSEPGGKAQD
ncbi:MAG: hypothetical protein ACYC66_03250 [Chloroflexota bacterium]